MKEHSLLPPSSAARRVACAGSRYMESTIHSEETEASREGDAAHWVAAERLHHRRSTVGMFAPNGEIITQEMIDCANVYVTDINTHGIMRKTDLAVALMIEKPLAIKSIHPDCWGTPDAWAWRLDEIAIWDYKFGHAPVDAYENWQLIEYAAGIVEFLGINGIDDQNTIIDLRIVQPRDYRNNPIKSWRIRLCELRPYFNILRAAEEAAMKPNAECTPSPQCGYCRARHTCPALADTAAHLAGMVREAQPEELTPISVGHELRYLEASAALLKARITGLQTQALAHIKSGERVPYYRLESGAGRERWAVDPKEILALGELMGVHVAKPRDLITPKQAVAAGLPAEIVRNYTKYMNGEEKLVAEDLKKIKKLLASS